MEDVGMAFESKAKQRLIAAMSISFAFFIAEIVGEFKSPTWQLPVIPQLLTVRT
jgi:hypothetical protein